MTVYWRREAVLALIEVYKNRPCLYDINVPEYHNRQKNREALQDMVNVVSKFIPEVTIEDCKKKYQGLRAQYTKQKGKLLESHKSETGTEPKLWCFEHLNFLRNSIRKGSFLGFPKNNEVMLEVKEEIIEDLEEGASSLLEARDSREGYEENCRQLLQEYILPSASPVMSTPPSPAIDSKRRLVESSPSPEPRTSESQCVCKRFKKSRSTEQSPLCNSVETSFMANVCAYLQRKKQSQTQEDAFGVFVASRLRGLNPRKSKKAQHKIVKLIFEFENEQDEDD